MVIWGMVYGIVLPIVIVFVGKGMINHGILDWIWWDVGTQHPNIFLGEGLKPPSHLPEKKHIFRLSHVLSTFLTGKFRQFLVVLSLKINY